ncbi:MAG: GTP-binding protein [Lachnospiraceae bacterium]|nr:GTP-binding protein [Lachnospiraceae bacterium]
MLEIPVYIATGFLESGKTSFIKEILEDHEFTEGKKVLVICCEEGAEEYDEEMLVANNAALVSVESPEELTTDFLKALQRQHRQKMTIFEYNGMWKVEDLLKVLPRNWPVVQTFTMIDASTFEMYLNNMRSIMMELVKLSDVVIFNRCDKDTKKGSLRRSVKAANRQVQIIYESVDGSDEDEDEDDLPFDVTADEIDLEDDDYGLWYLDAMDHPDRYEGKTMRFTAMVYRGDKLPKGYFVPGRFAMTCCAEDVTFVGFLCKSAFADRLKQREFIKLTATVKTEFRKEYQGPGPVLTAVKIEKADKPEEELVYFN